MKKEEKPGMFTRFLSIFKSGDSDSAKSATLSSSQSSLSPMVFTGRSKTGPAFAFKHEELKKITPDI